MQDSGCFNQMYHHHKYNKSIIMSASKSVLKLFLYFSKISSGHYMPIYLKECQNFQHSSYELRLTMTRSYLILSYTT